MSDDTLNRRQFLIRSGQVSAAAMLAACSPPADTKEDMGTKDASPDQTDTSDMDMGTDVQTDMDKDVTTEPEVALNKPPWVQLVDDGVARLRFETLTPEPLEVQFSPMGEAGMALMTAVTTTPLTYEWPTARHIARKLEWPDTPGDHSVHELEFSDLEPGKRYEWVINLGGEEVRGSFLAGMPRDQAFHMGWISDTMFPEVDNTAPLLAGLDPDIILHGGDFQYMTNPTDTWNGMFHRLAPAHAKAAMHICIGNHEYEDQDEFSTQYSRLFSTQNKSGTVEYHAFTFGKVRFLMLNSEIDTDTSSAQYQWMINELENLNGLTPVVAFHRPYYTFAKVPKFDFRDAWHPIMQQYNVKLVLTGHHHCYERFEADGVTYVVDGGGGAGLYKPMKARDEVIAARPEDENAWKASSHTHGVLSVKFNTDGTIAIERHAVGEGVVDSFTIG